MKTSMQCLILAGLIGLAVVLPFVVLELINVESSRAYAGFPLALFSFLWLLSSASVLLLTHLVRRLQSRVYSYDLLVSATCLVAIAIVISTLVIDQMPCFLGVPNCD